MKYWCKGYRWNRCCYVVLNNHSKSRDKTRITYDINQGTFTVTMADREPGDYGYYCCDVADKMTVYRIQMSLSFTPGKMQTLFASVLHFPLTILLLSIQPNVAPLYIFRRQYFYGGYFQVMLICLMNKLDHTLSRS